MLQPPASRPAVIAAVAVFITGTATAQEPDPQAALRAESNGLVHEVWTIEDGLPLSHLNGVVQGRDGYLWLSSFDGLIRFDGARFTVFNTSTNPEPGALRNVTLGPRRYRSAILFVRYSRWSIVDRRF